MDDPWMYWKGDVPEIFGTALRHHLTVLLLEAAGREQSVSDLVAALEREGFGISGRSSKTVSDTLRWEVRHGRARRVGRNRYVSGTMPKSTKSYIRRQVRARRQRVEAARRRRRQRELEQRLDPAS